MYGVQERLKKVPYQMKLEIKEVLRQLAFPNTIVLSTPPRKVPTKGAKKKVEIAKSRAKVASISRISSSWECVDSQNLDSQLSLSPTMSSFPKRKGACLGKTSCFPTSTIYSVSKVYSGSKAYSGFNVYSGFEPC